MYIQKVGCDVCYWTINATYLRCNLNEKYTMNAYIICQQKLSFKCLGKIYDYGYISFFHLVRNILCSFFYQDNNYDYTKKKMTVLKSDIKILQNLEIVFFTGAAPCCSDEDNMSSCCVKTWFFHIQNFSYNLCMLTIQMDSKGFFSTNRTKG